MSLIESIVNTQKCVRRDSGSSQRYSTGNMRKHVDIISTLPDELLCRIISLLPSKDAIGTSILSSRWKNLMNFVPVLDLTCHVPTIAFMNTLDKLLPSTSSSVNFQTIEKLRLQISDCHSYIVPVHVNSWVHAAINRKVVDLEVCLPDFASSNTALNQELALRIIASDSLQTLNISGGWGLQMPYTTGCFKNLKRFMLRISNPDKEILAKLFCSLPQLETLLVMVDFSVMRTRDMNICINIIAPVLKRLSLSIDQEDYHNFDFKVLIDTPMLENIYLEDDYLAAYSVMSLPSLVEATLDVGMDHYNEDYIDDDNRFVRAIELIRGLSNAKYLSIINSTSVALDWANQHLPILRGVNYLKLDDISRSGFSLIPMFLTCAPNLKKIVVTIQPEVNYIEGWSWISPSILPTSLSHLEEFEIHGAEIIGHESSFNVMMDYITKNAKALKMFKIN